MQLFLKKLSKYYRKDIVKIPEFFSEKIIKRKTNQKIKIITSIFILVFFANVASSKENFFDEALKMYQDKKYDDARFML